MIGLSNLGKCRHLKGLSVKQSQCPVHDQMTARLSLDLVNLEAKVKEAELLLFLFYDYHERAIPYSLPPRVTLLAVLLKSQ